MPTRKRVINLLLIVILSFGIVTCNHNLNSTTQSSPQQDSRFRVWWQQGFYPEEAEAIRRLVAEWEQENGIEVELTLYSDKDIRRATDNAIATGNTPDLLFNPSIDLSLIPRLAWENKLADVSDIISPIEKQFFPSVLETVNYQNNHINKRSYYAVPIGQQTANIHYWQDILSDDNLNPPNIPKSWDSFWNFWSTARNNLPEKTKRTIYALGLPMSSAAGDTFFIFEQFLAAYNVNIVDENGQLLLEDSQVRQGIIKALEKYTSFYQYGEVPPNAVNWGNPDNNVSFLSRQTLMTVNPSLSIPGSQRQDKDTYSNKIVSMEWPRKPDGSPMTYLSGVKQVIIFEASPNKEVAKSLLSYLIKPENLGVYLEKSQGRYFPVMPQLLEAEFWNDPADPHISVVAKQFLQTRPFPQSFNPAYTQVQAENIWGKAIFSILKQGKSPERAADRAIADIKKIFSQWKSQP